MSDIFDVLADPTRRRILTHLADAGEASVRGLVELLGVSQPTVSKHLATLREAELVTVREEGRSRFYAVRADPLAEVDGWLAGVLDGAGPSASSSAGGTILSAWAGADMGDRVGRVAADTAHSARVALEAAQEKLQGAQKRVVEKLPRRSTS